MNALTLLRQDHNNVDALFERFLQASDPATRREVVDRIVEHLAVHASIEEQLFYPAVRESAAGREPSVLEALEAHHVVKWTLSELEKMAPTDERFAAKVKVLIDSVRHHVLEEENELFPAVRDALSAEELERLGEAMETAKAVAPVRPHPRAPDTPPLNILIGTPVAVIDRALKTGRETLEKILRR